MKRILCFIAALITSLMSSSCGKNASADILTVTYIDVGKGDCILAECGGKALMIDAGYAETADRVLELLAEKGVDKLDELIITHYDKDHVGGAAAIAESLPVSVIYLPGYEGRGSYYKDLMRTISDKSVDSRTVTEDVRFSLGNTELNIFASDIKYSRSGHGDEGNDNDVSLVVSASHGKDSYLFAGDIEKDGIKSFVKKSELNYDVLKMPHHGRKESNTDKLIDSVLPKIAVITDSGTEPADKKTLSLLGDASVYRSSECGDIVIESGGDGRYNVLTSK